LIGGTGLNSLNGGSGFDVADISSDTVGGYVDMALLPTGTSMTVGSNQLVNIESILFGIGNDTIVGSNLADFVQSNDGNDFLTLGLGNDTLYGGRGSDILIGGEGDDSLNSGPATYNVGEAVTSGDTDYVYAGNGNDVIFGGGRGVDVLLGEAGNDTISDADGVFTYLYGGVGSNILSSNAQTSVFLSEGTADTMASNSANAYYYRLTNGSSVTNGGAGVDQFIGGNAVSNDQVNSGGGADFLFGGAGDDFLSGGADNDVIIGQVGNDTLEGGAGVNLLWANDAGNDQIRVNVADGGTQVLEFFEAAGSNDVVRLLGSSLTSFTDFTTLRNALGSVVGTNLLLNTGSGAQLYLNLGANQSAIWFQGVSAYSLTSADFLFS
jgi:Ca2+-binding RTX toxin-like protein